MKTRQKQQPRVNFLTRITDYELRNAEEVRYLDSLKISSQVGDNLSLLMCQLRLHIYVRRSRKECHESWS